MKEVLNILKQYRVVPVAAVSVKEQALRLAEVLTEKNLPILEITFRTSAASEAISAVQKNFPELHIGAGTLTSTDALQQAIDAGSQFFVSPGFNPKTVEYAALKGVTLIPGVSNPSLVEQAGEYGLNVLKFFPAEHSGGIGMLQAMGAVYPDVSFIPTGGITPDNINNYLKLDNVAACGASWMVSRKLVQDEDWTSIRIRIDDTLAKVQNISLS
ncbi:MAG: bifunctional 4-hydroxy-2-oxoglutarate aldolase/2-dehydro-3-deoxy-phosphogluconate aldolase [Spirochaetota bacterium]